MSTPRRPSRPARPVRRVRGSVRHTLDEFIEREIQRSGKFVVGIIILAAAVVNLWQPVQTWFEQQSRLAALQEEVATARATLAEAQSDMKRWSDRAYIEAQARQRLLFVYPGDISYLVVNDVKVKGNETEEVLSTIQATDIDWVDAFIQSYAFAAQTNGVAE